MGGLRRILGWPTRRLLDGRVRWVIDAVDDLLGGERGARPPVHRRLDDLEGTLSDMDGRLGGWHAEMDHGFRSLEDGVTAIVDAARQIAEGGGAGDDYTIPPLDRRALTDLRWPVAELLNWAAGPGGYAAAAGLWVNQPVQLAHHAGGVKVLSVNERILELPFAFASLADLPPGSHVLDVGGAESTLSLSLASLGFEVTVVDPRGYPFEHPNLRVAARRLESLDGAEDVDAAIAISSVEHFGLGAYGQPETHDREDLAAMAEIRRRLRPGGAMVLTVPFGQASSDQFQRTYDERALSELLRGFEIRTSVFARRLSETAWSADEVGGVADGVGVAMIHAVRPAE